MRRFDDALQSSKVVFPETGCVNRRSFLTRCTAGLVVASITPIGVTMPASDKGVGILFGTLGEAAGATLLRMARDLFPHDNVPDGPYLAVLAPYDVKAGSDASFKELVQQGLTQLDADAAKRFGKHFTHITAEGDRVSLLYNMEENSLFQTMLADVQGQLYNNEEVWPLLNYPGPSWNKGGYIDRGFDDINWL